MRRRLARGERMPALQKISGAEDATDAKFVELKGGQNGVVWMYAAQTREPG
jgi:hypothetical protein